MAENNDQNPGSRTSRVRQKILFIILFLAIGALVWEYKVAKPKSEEAWEAVTGMLNSNFSSGGEVTNTNEDVANAIGKSPAETKPDEHQAIEIYKWRRGLPFRSYEIQVLYEKKSDGQLFLKNAMFNEPLPQEILDPTAIPSTETDGQPETDHMQPADGADQAEANTGSDSEADGNTESTDGNAEIVEESDEEEE